jgi:hypothetical protein
MTVTSFPLIDVRFFTNAGLPAAGYQLQQYASGTTTNQDTFSDIAGTVPNAHPLVLDQNGRCSMFGAPGQSYTFVLINPITGATEWTRDNVSPAAIPPAGSFVPLDGSVPMTGLLTLSGPATSADNPPTNQQMTDAISAAVADMTTLVASATAAAAAATAAAAAVTPTFFSSYDKNGGATTRSITLQPGTWQCVLETEYFYSEGVGGNYTITPTQSATVGTASLATSSTISRAGGSGYGRNIYGRGVDVQTLVLSVATTVTMAMSAAVLGAATSKGSRLNVSKIA